MYHDTYVHEMKTAYQENRRLARSLATENQHIRACLFLAWDLRFYFDLSSAELDLLFGELVRSENVLIGRTFS